MAQRHLIVSTCGTSLFTNQVQDELRKLLTKYANAVSAEQIPTEVRELIEPHIQKRREELVDRREPAILMALSAELNGLLRWYHGRFPARAPDHHVLLCTDTWLGENGARIIADILQQAGLGAEVYRVKDLQTEELPGFQAAMTELATWCAGTLRKYSRQGYRVVFNLTGGFKSVQGFMQALAMLYADESVYVFESGHELLRLPRLPLKLDAEATVRAHLAAFRRMGAQLAVAAAEVAGIPDTLLFVDGGQATLSAWGEIVWREACPRIYEERLWDSPSRRLRFGSGFERSIRTLAGERLRLVNERVDQLARYLESNQQIALSSLDFKILKNPVDDSTHECDAWADQDAKRLFGHFEGEIFVLDRLDKKL